MYATMIQYDASAVASTEARARVARSLATTLGELSGFVAFVALDGDAGMVAALCIVDDRTSMNDAQRRITEWLADVFGATGARLEEIGTGAVITQKGL